MTDNPFLEEHAFGVADANGRCVLRLKPSRAFEYWRIKNTAVQSSSTTLLPTCRTYRNAESPSTFIEGTYVATFDNSDTVTTLNPGEGFVAVFSGADVGSRCAVTITGDRLGR